jgi:hypothetical protein
MAMTRQQLRHQAAVARYQAGKLKPPTRKQVQAWLAPIRKAFTEIRTGEVDAHRGYAITRINWADEDFARIDHCINGFTAMLDRLAPAFDTGPLKRVSKKLETGILLTPEEVDACFAVLAETEERLLTFTREQLIDASKTEQINIELEIMGLKECATG